MKTEKVQRTETRYICENCGAKHTKPTKITICPYSKKEICEKCAKRVLVYKWDWQDFIEIKISPDLYVQGYDEWKYEYKEAINEAEQNFYEKLDEITKKYLSKDDDYFRKYIV